MRSIVPSRTWRYLGPAAMLFGAATVWSGGRALFGPPEAQAALGQVVIWVLWFNFCAGFAYMAVGWGLWRDGARWALRGSALIAGLTALFALALGIHISRGGGFEMRTAGAMVLRLGFWVSVTWVAFRAHHAVRSARHASV